MVKTLKRGFSVFLVLLMVFSSIPLAESFADILVGFAITASATDVTNETENNSDLVESSRSSRTMFAATASIDTPITPDDESNASKYGICEYFTGWYDGGNHTAGVIRRNYALRIVKIYPDGSFYGIGYVLPRSGSSTANGSYYLKGNIDFTNMTLSWQGYEWIKKISDDFDFLDFYNGSISETNNVLTGNTGWGDVMLTSDENELNLVYSKLVNLTSDNNFRVIVKDGSGNLVSGAEVSIYSGKNVIATATSNNGDAIFIGFDINKNKNATVSAHLSLPYYSGELELCSEYIDPNGNGVWEGIKIKDLGNDGTLVVDEPRLVLNLSVAHVGNSKHNSLEKIKKVLSEYSYQLAQMTNGHIVISNFSINMVSTETELERNSSDILIYPADDMHSKARIGGYYGDDTCHIRTCMDELKAETLCHETGHYVAGFYDEYCYGLGYKTDTNDDGKIDSQDSENSGYWKTHDSWGFLDWYSTASGTVDRPKDAPSNFGVMDVQHTTIEMSNSSSYEYLTKNNLDSRNPVNVTQQYYERDMSCEEYLAYVLEDIIAAELGYTASYSCATKKQTSNYSYSKVMPDEMLVLNSAEVNRNVDLLADYTESQKEITNIQFLVEDTNIKVIANDEISLYYDTLNDDKKINITPKQSDNFATFSIEPNEIYFLYVVDNANLCYNTYRIETCIDQKSIDNGFCSISIDGETERTILVTSSILYENDLISVNKIVDIVESDIDKGKLNTVVVKSNYINYKTLSWYRCQDNSFEKLPSEILITENENIQVSCNINGEGKYVLMSEMPSDGSLKPVLNLSASDEGVDTDGEINILFDDTNNENTVLYYEVYYSNEEFGSNDLDRVDKCIFLADDKRINLLLEPSNEYYVSIIAIGADGSRSAMSEILKVDLLPIDSNNDGIPNSWFEVYYQIEDTKGVANLDTDEDGLTNLQEYELGTNPIDPDTDDDNVYDGVEVDNDLDPLKEKSNGVDFDYILLYGQPNLSVTSESVGISDEDFIFKVKNEAEGAALRTNIKIVSNGNILFAWEVNIRAYDEIEITAPISTLSSYDNFEIVVDENQITYDSDYTNNNLIVGVSDEFSIDHEERTMVKNTSEKVVPIVTHDYCECFRFASSNNKAVVVDDYGNLTAKGIGISTITITNMRGYAKSFDVYVVAFEGAEYSEFDSKLINNSTEVSIIGYIGDDSGIVIPETIGSLPVTQLASNAFKGCSFDEVTIHSGINSIANNTFLNTLSLERIVVDEANASYCSVKGILYSLDKTQLVKYPSAKTDAIFAIPETVTSIGAYSVNDCDYIEEITVPESVASIGSSAIGNCNNLKRVNYNAVSSSAPIGIFGSAAFNGSNAIEKVIIGDNVTVIPQYLFFGRNNLTEVAITENSKLTTISQCAFYNCSKISNIFIPKTVKTIGSSAFYGCSKLNGIELPEVLISIGTSAFSGCSSLTSIKIPETVTSISDNTFANCTALEKIEIPYQITTIGETPFKGCSKLVIWCHNNSVAYEYAIANSIKYKIMEFDADDLAVTGLQNTYIDGLQYQLSAEIAPIYTDEKIVWSSSDSKVFTVSNTGLITAKGAGEAILTVASSRGSVSKTFNINVLGLSKDSENANLYHVRNADDMLTLSTMVNNGVSFAGKIIQLDNDIDLSNIDWTPIGIDSTYVFSGVFDGNNHTISGLNYVTTSNTYSGLFGYIKTGGIKDLTVEGSVSGISRVGMIAGCIFDSALYNCKAIGEVKRIGSGSYGYVGGLAGSALHSVIINCAAETDITVDFGTSSIYYAAVGGIAGVASTSGSEPMCILNSYCIGDISVNGKNYYSSYDDYYVGGIAGYLKDDAANNYYFGEITNADEDPIKKIGYAFGYVVPEYTSESDYNGIGTIIVQDNYYLEGKNAVGLISEGDYDSTNWTSAISEENFSKLIGEGSLVDELNGNKGSVEEIIVAHRDILSNSTWAELVDRINGDSFTVSNWKIGSNNLPVNYECDCYRHAESDWVVDVEATCTKEGSKHTYCLVCQETVTTSIIEKVEHKFSDWTETKAATCTEKGSECRTCTTCSSATKTRDIAELGHNFVGEWTTDKAPTCTKSGVESRICTRCKSEKETRTVDKLGHDFESKWTVDKEATCSKVGSKSHHCSRCDEKSDVTVINKIAHSYRESVQEATCTKDGKKTYNCSACGDSYSEVITAKGHIDQNGDGKCDNCDYIYDNTCDHMCHKSGFMGFIWKIVRFFWKLFKMNPVCECGIAHY